MVAPGGDSVAAKLHYPEKAKAEKKEAAVQFYCEVNIDGHTRHRTIIAEDTYGPFYRAVQKAIQQGRFAPARVGGKPAKVMIGGTVLFLSAKGPPTIVVSLATVTGLLRIASDKHYATDVVVGALVGSAIGYAVPTIHFALSSTDTTTTVVPEVSPNYVGLAFTGRF